MPNGPPVVGDPFVSVLGEKLPYGTITIRFNAGGAIGELAPK